MIRKAVSFRFRAFGVFWLGFSFLLSALSGAILFLRPEGSLATWTGWTALGLNKKQWEAVHAVFVFTLVVSAAIHMLYNRRPLLAYCRLKKEKIRTVFQGLAACREFIAAALLTATVLIGAIGEWLPVRWIVGWRGAFKSGAALVTLAPPVADADKSSLSGLCALTGVSGQQVLRNARAYGLQLRALNESLIDVAKKNGLSPEKTYGLLFMK